MQSESRRRREERRPPFVESPGRPQTRIFEQTRPHPKLVVRIDVSVLVAAHRLVQRHGKVQSFHSHLLADQRRAQLGRESGLSSLHAHSPASVLASQTVECEDVLINSGPQLRRQAIEQGVFHVGSRPLSSFWVSIFRDGDFQVKCSLVHY